METIVKPEETVKMLKLSKRTVAGVVETCAQVYYDDENRASCGKNERRKRLDASLESCESIQDKFKGERK